MTRKQIRRKLYLAYSQLIGRPTLIFAPHGVSVRVPPGIDDDIRYHLTRNRPYEEPEARMVKSHLRHGTNVIELGGSLGVVSALIRSVIGPEARHLIVEANARLIEICTENASRVANPGATEVIFSAIDYSGRETVRFNTGSNAHIGKVDANCSGVEVPTIRLSDLARRLPDGPFALVCDIEGMEEAMFANETALLHRLSTIILETHPGAYATGHKATEAMMKRLTDSGLTLVDSEDGVMCFVRAR